MVTGSCFCNCLSHICRFSWGIVLYLNLNMSYKGWSIVTAAMLKAKNTCYATVLKTSENTLPINLKNWLQDYFDIRKDLRDSNSWWYSAAMHCCPLPYIQVLGFHWNYVPGMLLLVLLNFTLNIPEETSYMRCNICNRLLRPFN